MAVTGLTSGVTDLRAGDNHTCAVTHTGATQCWGNNSDGQLGDGSTTSRLAPVAVSTLNNGVALVEGATRHSCALTATGGVKCWGNNSSGQLGNGTTIASLTPIAVSGLASGIASLAAGDTSSCATTTGGGAQCWGAVNSAKTPQDINGFTSGVQEIGIGNGTTCVLTGSSAMQCWGSNGSGQLGDGTTTNRTTPATVTGLTGGKAANQTITFPALPGKTIGDTPFTVTASTSSGLAVAFSSITPGVCSVAGSSVTLAATGICTIAANQAGNGSVNAAQQVTQSFNVAPATQTITGFAPGTPITYSSGLSLALSATGGASGNPVLFASTTPAVCTVAGSIATVLTAGTCTLTANQAGNAVYSAAPQVTATVLITAASQSISFAALPGKKMGDAPTALSATASSGLAVTFTSATPAVCTAAGNSVTLAAAGMCSIAADQAGNGSINAAPQVMQSFTIAPAGQTIAFAALPGKKLGDAPFILDATASSGLPVSFTSMTPAVCTVDNGALTLITTGTCTIAADQAGDGNVDPAPQVVQSLLVSSADTQVYYIHSDHLNTPRLITDVNNNPVWEWKNSDPFGANLPNENPSNLGTFTYNPRFAGQYFDKETGLHYNYYRDYDPSTGRYVQSDPIGLFGGINTYGYTGANPVNRADPSGLAWKCNVWGAGAVCFNTPPLVDPFSPQPSPGLPTWTLPDWLWDLIDGPVESRSQGKGAEARPPDVNPGKDCDGRCNPCPPNPPSFDHQGDAHGSTGGFHTHQWQYHQAPDCTCRARKESW